MSRTKHAWTALIVLAFWMAIPDAGPCSAAEKVFRMRREQPMQTFDPARVTNHTTAVVLRLIHDHLVDYTPGAWPQIEPQLAEKYVVSGDGRTYTFYLKKGVRWQKGFGEFTSEDMRFTVERVMDSKNKFPLRSLWTEVISKIETPDPHTIRFILKKPDPSFLTKIAPWRMGAVVCKKAVEKFGPDYAQKPETIVGSGPFEVSAFTPDQKLILKRFAEYHGRKPKLDRIEMYMITDESTGVLSLQKGEIDLTIIREPENLVTVRKAQNLNIYTGISGTTKGFIALNTEHPVLKDVRVRRAMIHALDRDLIIKALGEMARKACGWLAPGVYWGAIPCDELPSYPYDPALAKKLLAEAGYPNGFKLKYVGHNEKSFADLDPVLQAYWKEVGIETEIELLPLKEWLARMYQGTSPAIKFVMGTRPPEPSLFLFSTFHSSSAKPGMNAMLYKGVDDLLDKAHLATNERERKAIYAQIQKKIMEDAVIIPIFFETAITATRQNVDLGRGAKGKELMSPFWHYFWLEEIDLK